MDIQLAFRETGQKTSYGEVYMAYGFVRARGGVFDIERVAHFGIRQDGRGAIVEIGLTGVSSNLDIDDNHRLSCGLDSLLTATNWPLSVSGLSLFMRETRLDPIDPCHQVLGVVGFVTSFPMPLLVDQDAIHAFSGPSMAFARPDLERRPERGMVELSRGMKPDQVLRQPLWGFGENPVGLRATLELGICDLLDRQRELSRSDPRSEMDEAELVTITSELRSYGLPGPGSTDVTFQKAMQWLAENHPHLLTARSGDPADREAIEEYGAAMKSAVIAVTTNTAPSPR